MKEQNQNNTSSNPFLYVGTYTGGNSGGIYTCRFDTATGKLEPIGVKEGVENPSYLAIDAKRLRLYAVNEVSDFNGQPGGSVSAFAIHAASGELSLINQQYSHGGAPCYLTLNDEGRYLYVVNYSGGNVIAFPIQEDGAVGEAADIATHSGRSLNPERQDYPHPHSIVLDPANNYAFVPDLGIDKVMQYVIDRNSGQLSPSQSPWVDIKPGSGPRHMLFHPSGKYAYIINELSSTISVCTYDPQQGALRVFQTIPTVPEGYAGENTAAGIHLTPSGKVLFGSNRGHDSVACYAVDQETGALSVSDFVHTQGRTPRGFTVDTSGTFLLVANQDSDSIVTFSVDEGNGTLVPKGQPVRIPSPVCLKMVRFGR